MGVELATTALKASALARRKDCESIIVEIVGKEGRKEKYRELSQLSNVSKY